MGSQTKEQQELARRIEDDYRWAVSYRDQFTDDWKRYNDLYDSFLDSSVTTYPFESDTFIPYTFTMIETQLPILMQMLLQGGDFVEVFGRKLQSQPLASAVKSILQMQYEQDINFSHVLYKLAKQALILGTSPIFSDWEYVTRLAKVKVPSYNVMGDVIGERAGDVTKVLKNNPRVDVIDLLRYFQCPAEGSRESPWTNPDVLYAGWEFAITYEEMVELNRTGIYNNNIKGLKGHEPPDEVFSNRESVTRKNPQDKSSQFARPQFTCINYFGNIPKSHGLELHNIVAVYPDGLGNPNGSIGTDEIIIIRDEIEPFKHGRIPIDLVRVNYKHGDLYGISDIGIIEGLQQELNDQRNQRNDIIVQTMAPMYKISKVERDIDDADLIYRPHNIIRMEDINNLAPMHPPVEHLRNAFLEEDVLKRDIQFATGISDFVVGQFQNSSGFNDTATGITAMQAAAQGRVILKGNFLELSIKNTAEMIWELDKQFLQLGTVFNVLDPLEAMQYKFIIFDDNFRKGDFGFRFSSGSSAGNPMIKKQETMQILQTLTGLVQAASAQGQQIMLNWEQLIITVLKTFEFPNMANIVPSLLENQQIALQDLISQDAPEDAGDPQVDPETQNRLMAEGNMVSVHSHDNDLEHIIKHNDFMRENDFLDDQIFMDHISEHEMAISSKQQALLNFASNSQRAMQNTMDPNMDNKNPAQQVGPRGNEQSPTAAQGAETRVRNNADNY